MILVKFIIIRRKVIQTGSRDSDCEINLREDMF